MSTKYLNKSIEYPNIRPSNQHEQEKLNYCKEQNSKIIFLIEKKLDHAHSNRPKPFHSTTINLFLKVPSRITKDNEQNCQQFWATSITCKTNEPISISESHNQLFNKFPSLHKENVITRDYNVL
jgi:hypothetical protein